MQLPRLPLVIMGLLLAPLTFGQRECGTDVSEDQQYDAAEKFKSALDRLPSRARNSAPSFAPINVYFHVVTKGDSVSDGNHFESTITNQINVLNRDYSPSGISFNLANISYTYNPAWYRNAINNNSHDAAMKNYLRVGGAADLNIYSVGMSSAMASGTLGYTTFPFQYAASPILDGVVIHSASLPGGSPPFDLGHTAVHEVGHWLGLYHTFGNGHPSCVGLGDEVDDTPMERTQTTGCPEYKDTCPDAPGDDPIHNYMDYSDDSCLTGFTPGQIQRMQNQLSVYRLNSR